MTLPILSCRYLCIGLVCLSVQLPAIADDTTPNDQTTLMTRVQDIKDHAANLVTKAIDFLGTRYKRGGNTVEQGLDCSGLVRLVYKDAANIDLPRTSLEISREGEKINSDDLQPGDLVFFNTLKRGFSHVGIYLGDNKFIHSPSAGGQVRIESMNIAYWKNRFNGARRINNDNPN